MTFHTCRFCKKAEASDFIKYGPRHHAHFACYLKANPGIDGLRKLTTHTLRVIPYIVVIELGILDQIKEVLRQRGVVLE